MDRLEIQETTADELLREIERSASTAVKRELEDLRESVERLQQNVYHQKTWLTLEEATEYAGVSLVTLRGWREDGLSESNVGGRTYIKREDIDAYIAEQAEE